MARLARLVAPGIPHPVTQRGNRLETTFFGRGHHMAPRRLLAAWCRQRGVAVRAYRPMPSHVHLLLVPPEGAQAAIGRSSPMIAASRRSCCGPRPGGGAVGAGFSGS
jgi:putative transposase